MNEHDRRAKTNWKRQEKERARALFPLRDEELVELFDAVDAAGARDGCDGTRLVTDTWLVSHGHDAVAVRSGSTRWAASATAKWPPTRAITGSRIARDEYREMDAVRSA